MNHYIHWMETSIRQGRSKNWNKGKFSVSYINGTSPNFLMICFSIFFLFHFSVNIIKKKKFTFIKFNHSLVWDTDKSYLVIFWFGNHLISRRNWGEIVVILNCYHVIIIHSEDKWWSVYCFCRIIQSNTFGNASIQIGTKKLAGSYSNFHDKLYNIYISLNG